MLRLDMFRMFRDSDSTNRLAMLVFFVSMDMLRYMLFVLVFSPCKCALSIQGS